jgi:hypothetical protein
LQAAPVATQPPQTPPVQVSPEQQSAVPPQLAPLSLQAFGWQVPFEQRFGEQHSASELQAAPVAWLQQTNAVVSHTAGERQSSPSWQRDPGRRWPTWLVAVVQTPFWHESSTPQSLSVRHRPPVATTQTLAPVPACESQIAPEQHPASEVHDVPRQAGRAVQAWFDGLHASPAQQSFPVTQPSLSLLQVGVGSHTLVDELHTSPLQHACEAHDAPC